MTQLLKAKSCIGVMVKSRKKYDAFDFAVKRKNYGPSTSDKPQVIKKVENPEQIKPKPQPESKYIPGTDSKMKNEN